MKNVLPAPYESETWLEHAKRFFWHHPAIETLVICMVVTLIGGSLIVAYFVGYEAIDMASRTLGVG